MAKKERPVAKTTGLSHGAPGEIRTPDHQVRSLVLYPAELRAHETFSRRTFHGVSIQSASLPPPHARHDSPPDCRKRLAFDQLSCGRMERASLPWSGRTRNYSGLRRNRQCNRRPMRASRNLAEREGFEPSIRLLTRYSLSRGAPSASRAPLRFVVQSLRAILAHPHRSHAMSFKASLNARVSTSQAPLRFRHVVRRAGSESTAARGIDVQA